MTSAVAASGGSGENDPQVVEAERSLRAAELRAMDEVAMSLYRRASAAAEAALKRNPDSAGANFVYFAAMGRILMADGVTKHFMTLRNLDREHLDRALELNPRYANALSAKGGVLLDLPTLFGGDPEEALKLLRRALSINPGGAGSRLSLAKALARTGNPAEAQKEAMRAAHHACIQGRRKVLDDAVALLGELGATARAEPR